MVITLLSSCSTVKVVPEGEYRLKKNSIIIPVNSRVSIITVVQTGAILFTDSSDTIISDDDASITTDSVTTFGNGVVKMFSRGQLNSRLWL